MLDDTRVAGLQVCFNQQLCATTPNATHNVSLKKKQTRKIHFKRRIVKKSIKYKKYTACNSKTTGIRT